jgi:hypothetical protein
VSGALTHTISVPEVIWLLIGLVGLFVSWRNLLDAYRDLLFLNYSGRNGGMRVIALGNVREELLRVLACVVIALIGIAAMSSPPANTTQPVSTLAVIITVGLFLLGSLVVVGSVAARRTRQTATKLLVVHVHNGDKGERGERGPQGIQGVPGPAA